MLGLTLINNIYLRGIIMQFLPKKFEVEQPKTEVITVRGITKTRIDYPESLRTDREYQEYDYDDDESNR